MPIRKIASSSQAGLEESIVKGGPLKEDRNTAFVRWTFETEKRYREWLKNTPSNLNDSVAKSNVFGYGSVFSQLQNRCVAPGCGYPLRNDGGADKLPIIGDVCNLCYYMYHLVNSRVWFVTAHREEEELRKKNKWDDRK